jgi:tRNA/rRNA methyltransferase
MTAIILDRPQMGENIGAAARIMYNFGLTDLRIVAPRDGWQGTPIYDKAHEMAAKADFIIEQAKLFENLPDAVADINYLYATTARPRDMVKDVILPSQITLHGKTGFLFGRESSGLDNAAITMADKIITVPVNPDYGSINIAMSVGLVAYEIANYQLPQNPEPEPATKADLFSMFEYLEDELEKRQFFSTPEKQSGMMVNIKNFLSRRQLTAQDVRTFRGVIKCLATK